MRTRRAIVAAAVAAALIAGRALPARAEETPVSPPEASSSGEGGAAGASDASNAADASDAAPVEAAPPVQLPVVNVVATRSALPVSDPSAALSEVTGAEIERSAARTIDDVLRRIAGFSLFRRLGSGAAHPTTQGVSLRGIGASGTSRALVLVDGVPVNDPFGGWVYWSRLPFETVERVDVLRGSGASLWGNYAMGGVVGISTRAADRNAGGLVAEGGERGSGRTEGWITRRFGDTSLAADARWMRSGDFPVIREDSRGPIDTPAGSEHESGGFSLTHDVTPELSLHAAARGFHEYRDNGTPYTHNETESGCFRTGLDWKTPSSGTVEANVFGTVQSFWSTFSSVAPDRASETPASDQYSVPSQSAGGSVVWSNEVRDVHHLAAGIDALWVDGESQELGRYIEGTFTRRRDGGASQGMGGVFFSDIAEVTERLDVTGALRLDYWETYDGFRREDALDTGAPLTDRALDGRSEFFVSPRLGLAYAATDAISLRAAAYRGFRAPTINEQVRPFRVRNDVTEANEKLDAEKLTGVEGGFDLQYSIFRSSATLFWNQIDDPIVNVTIGEGGAVVDPCGFVPAGGVCRQRRNLGSSRILGVESEVGVEIGYGLSARLSYLWNDGKIHSAKAEPSLAGNRIPQVPEHQGAIGLDYDHGGPWRASVQVRVAGEQFEDDANSRQLDAYASVDAYVARDLGYGFEAFVAAENLFDETIQTGRSADGVVSIGAPRLVRGGLRYTFGEN